ncbi:NmrA family transcriptional regulator [Devosia sp. Root105]|uniref:NmrA family NAD(P)-binding protein n=1 Tax=Devosia sp. Root105 TaxID=1736423 RepID=UPI000A40FD32|nr:NmrA family transcriptional regulator [Devosia sp. Root105]
MTKPILIIGGRGKTGARVAERLEVRGLPVRLASRSTGFDWTDRGTWAAALEGAASAYITYYPDIAIKGAAEAIGAITELALSLGLKRLVLLSGRGEPEAQRAEQQLIASDADWTVVRASWFNQNFDEGQFLEMVLGGEVALPVDAVREPFVDCDDIADVVTAALTDDRHIGQLYEVTGPRLLTFAEVVAEINRASGSNVTFRTMPAHEFLDSLAGSEMPEEIAGLLEELFSEVLDGRNESLADGVQRVLGRQPKDVADFAREAAAKGAWRQP